MTIVDHEASSMRLAVMDRSVAVVEPDRIVVTTGVGDAATCELGIDPSAAGVDIAFVGNERLLVLTRYAAHALAHLVDVAGPRKLADVRFEAPLRVLAARGDRALLGGAQGLVVVTRHGDILDVAQLPMRAVPALATWQAGDRFLVNVGGQFEEWDVGERSPVRRFRLERPTTVRLLGSSAGYAWWATAALPTTIEVMPPAGRGPIRRVTLPEPCATAVSGVGVPILVALGAETKQLYVVELELPGEITPIDGAHADAVAWSSDRPPSVIAAAPDEAPRRIVLPLRRRPGVSPSRDGDGDGGHGHADGDDSAPATGTSAIDGAEPPASGDGVPVGEVAAETEPSIAQRLLAWRDRMRTAARPELAASNAPPAASSTWRDELVAWGRAVTAGLHRDAPPWPAGTSLASLARLGLSEDLLPAVALAYATYLVGRRGVAPADLADLLGHRWDEALGRGQLAASGALRWSAGKAVLTGPVLAWLDENPAITGEVHGRGAPRFTGIGAVVAPDEALGEVAQRSVTFAGAVLAARPGARLPLVLLEARLRDAVPLLEASASRRGDLASPVLVRVLDRATADGLGIPVVDLP